jgi:outer membrane protein
MRNKLKIIQALIVSALILYGESSNLLAQKSYSMIQAIEHAIGHNTNLKQQGLDLADANYQIKEFKSIAMPKIATGLTYQYFFAVPAQPIPNFITPSVYDVLFNENLLERFDPGPPDFLRFAFNQPHYLQGNAEINMLVFDGSYLYGLKAAKIYEEIARTQFKLAETELIHSVTKSYLAILIAEENKKMLDKNIRNLQQSIDEMLAMYDAGMVESLDVDRLELSLQNLQTESKRISDILFGSYNLLKYLMGVSLNEQIKLTDELNDEIIAADYYLIQGISALNLEDRPEYRALEINEKLNEIDYNRINATRLPTVRAYANTQQTLQRRNLFSEDEIGFIPSGAVGFNVNIPIYDGGERSARSQRAKINSEKTRLMKEDFVNSVRLEAENSLQSLQIAKQTVEIRKKAMDLAESIYNKSNIKFKEGVGSSVELTQAESAYLQTQSSYINALYDLIISRVDLEKAMGKL